MNEQKVSGLLGLALRSGKVTLGANQAVTVVRSGRAMAVLMDISASENTIKLLRNSCQHHGVPLVETSAGMIDRATGKQGRKAAALLHSDISKEIIKHAVVGEDEKEGNKAGVQATNG